MVKLDTEDRKDRKERKVLYYRFLVLYSKGLEGEKGKMGGQGGRGGKVTWELEELKGRKESKGRNVMWDLKARMLRKRHWFDMNNVEGDEKSLYVLASLVWVGRHSVASPFLLSTISSELNRISPYFWSCTYNSGCIQLATNYLTVIKHWCMQCGFIQCYKPH